MEYMRVGDYLRLVTLWIRIIRDTLNHYRSDHYCTSKIIPIVVADLAALVLQWESDRCIPAKVTKASWDNWGKAVDDVTLLRNLVVVQ